MSSLHIVVVFGYMVEMVRLVGRVPKAVRAVFVEQFTICPIGKNFTVSSVDPFVTSKSVATIHDTTVVEPNLGQASLDQTGPIANSEHHYELHTLNNPTCHEATVLATPPPPQHHPH